MESVSTAPLPSIRQSQDIATPSHAAAEVNAVDLRPSIPLGHLIENSDRAKLVTDAMREKDTCRRRRILETLLSGGPINTAGVPTMFFVDDLMDMFPSAPIILNPRPDPESIHAVSWAKDMRDKLAFFSSPWFYIVCFWVSRFRAQSRMHKQIAALYASARWALLPKDSQPKDWMTPRFCGKYNEYVRAQAERRGREVLNFTSPMDGRKVLREVAGKGEGLPADEVARTLLGDHRDIKQMQRMMVAFGVASWSAILSSAGGALWSASMLQKKGVASDSPCRIDTPGGLVSS